jgi:hypothetical protein
MAATAADRGQVCADRARARRPPPRPGGIGPGCAVEPPGRRRSVPIDRNEANSNTDDRTHGSSCPAAE